jgi:hypothetical protein
VATLLSNLSPSLKRALSWAGAYLLWIVVFKLLALTLVTYFMHSSNPSVRFDEISEAIASNELTLLGLASLGFLLLLWAFYPITQTRRSDIVTAERIEKRFVPGFMHGALLSSGIALAFILAGYYRFLGIPFDFEEAPLQLAAIAVRVLALICLAYSEEFIFRGRIATHISKQLPPLPAAFAVAGLYVLVKAVQFDFALGIMQMTTLALLSLVLTFRARRDRDFASAAGFVAAILVVFHPLLSLPIFGNDFTGIALIKFLASGGAVEGSEQFELQRFLSGGAGGPFSSFAFQLILLLDLLRGTLRKL